MVKALIFILVVFPFLSALCCYAVRKKDLRSLIILVTGGVLAAGSVLLVFVVPFSWMPDIRIHKLVRITDFLLVFLICFYGLRYRDIPVLFLSTLQIILAGYLEFFLIGSESTSPVFYCDSLSLIMVLIISVIGSAICLYAIPYMKTHEAHQSLEASRQPRFFFVMILFLGAMNGLVLSNDLTYFALFFELTTLCSFLLIGHDHSLTAVRNALRALWMNSLGGVALTLGMIGTYKGLGTLDMQEILRAAPGTDTMLLPLSLICFAAFVKAAQIPFQSWLLGAMVAPTPVSALLHSSTMVKAGVYLVVRLAPAFAGTFLSLCIGLVGAFSFLSAAALAVGQSNGKKILAYSTVSNLGLIFACVGLNVPGAIAAAVFLIFFHAVSKALLFLCVGTIEQHISSRDIEDMHGLYAEMPLTALITVMGVITMILPPFGMTLGKWMAMEWAAGNLFVIVMLALGSALTVIYWARWAGTLMSAPFTGKVTPERQSVLIRGPLVFLCSGAVILSLAAPWLYPRLILPLLSRTGPSPYTVHNGILQNSMGAFAVYPLSVIAALGFAFAVLALKGAQNARVSAPYLSGAQTTTPGTFNGPMNQPVKAVVGNYYVSFLFGEEKLTLWVNLGAWVLLVLMLGGTL